ncbi:MAG: methyl-accepting chemotaxis protein [Nitrosomonadales bacterium]|nr:methyl-accepting chemotaxis protein [Nitrosomonadales bacterium]
MMLNDTKISSRLTALLGFILSGLIVVGVMGLFVANKIAGQMEEVLVMKVTPLIHLNAISRANLSNRIAIANAIVQPERMAEFSETVAKNKAEIDTHWEAFMTSLTDQEDKDLAKTFADLRGQFVEKAVKPAVAAMRTNNADELKRIMVENVNPLYIPMFNAMDAIVEMEKNDIEKLHKDGDELYRKTQMISIALILVGVISGSLLGMSIIRGIRRSVDEMRNVMVTMSADGNLNARAKVYGKDEIGQTAVAFNTLIDGFANIIRQVNTSAVTVSGTAAKLASSSAQIAQSSLTQSEAAASTAAAVEEITVSINSVAANAEKCASCPKRACSRPSRAIRMSTS